MDIKITDEQVEKIVEKVIKDYVLENFKKKLIP
jgi:hypothetical protein